VPVISCYSAGHLAVEIMSEGPRLSCCQAEKLSSLGAAGKDKSSKTREEAEKLLGETVRHCEEMMAGTQAALEGMRSRCGVMPSHCFR